MKVLLIDPMHEKLRGSGRHVQYLIEALSNKVKFELWNIRKIGYINFPKLRSISFYINCKKREIPKDIDIIHIHNPKFAGLFKGSCKNILTIHGDYEMELKMKYGRIIKPILWYINKQMMKANVITTVSPYWAEIKKWRWIPNMINLKKVESILPSDECYILFVGRDDPIKNYPTFRKIAKQAYEEIGIKSLALGIMKEDVEYLKHDKVPWECVISYMKSAYAMIITSKQEGFPSTILEAWASGCPVVAYKIPPLIALAEKYPNSFLLFNDMKEALKILKNLRNKEVREKLIQNAKEYVKQFDSRIVAEEYYKLYKSLIKSF
ncbi:MAG: glycosyltransferase family 4 protein [Candidatus Methanomethylicaceae archaeon]